MSIETALTTAAQELQEVCDSARLDAELLLMFVLNAPRSHLIAHAYSALSMEEAARFAALVKRRLDQEPVAYLTGSKEFWSMSLAVTADTLVPRPETELLVEQALTLIPPESRLNILDLGTGSGAVALAISSERPLCHIVATDISMPALAVAADNAARHGLTNMTCLQGDWLQAVPDRTFDIIVSNPPYVASGDPALDKLPHEPRDALVAGMDGLAALQRIAATAAAHLTRGGTLLFEHGADQEKAVAKILANNGWRDIRCFSDLHGLSRVTRASRPKSRH